MKWYKQTYVNHRDWILENMENLNLSDKEIILVLLIDFCNSNNLPITMESIQRKTSWTNEEIDNVISVLNAKKYLEIKASSKTVRFILDGLFNVDIAQHESVLDASIFDTFEKEFARPLTQKEMEKLSDWLRNMDSKLIIYALREASMYHKVSFAYISSILSDWQAKGVTSKAIEDGKRING